MTKQYKTILSVLILPLLLLTACQQNDTDIAMNEDQMSDDATQQQITQFRSELQTELQQIDQELSQLEQSLAQVGDTAASGIEQSISDLRQERQEIEQNLQQLSQETSDQWQNSRSDLRRRVDELAVDVSRARMMAADTVEEFKSIAQEELNEIDQTMNRYQGGATSGQGTYDGGIAGDQSARGMEDMQSSEDMAQDQPLPNAEDMRVDPSSPTIGDGTTTAGTDSDVADWQEERQELAQEVEQLDATAEDDFRDRKEELADAIADLNAEVRQAVTRMMEGSDFVQADF